MDFQGFQDPMACRECLAFRATRADWEKGVKRNTGTKGRERKWGPRGKSGPPGMMGIKGARGIVGNQGIKGVKGEKGESVTSPSSAVPQTNWKQCVWKNLNDDQDSGKIKVKKNVLIGNGCHQNNFSTHHISQQTYHIKLVRCAHS